MTESTARPQMMTFFSRLREARLTRGLSQAKFGQLGRVSRNAQSQYESGERSPDSDYLGALHAHGIDVAYILTGELSQSQVGVEETRLVHAFSQCGVEDQTRLLDLAQRFGELPVVVRKSERSEALPSLPSEAALERAFLAILTASREMTEDELAHELAARLPTLLAVAQGPLVASPVADEPPAARAIDRPGGQRAYGT